ncbi:hypothetical protein A2U01_0072393 [Trifolium medium]|uniref:Uncharacterized protein n=1 Tax=Trifolium medium TaxID=97028 RepID=A0A392SR33_9FABA|nr:hypothetical protein [Trifolium medium]
MYCAARRVFFCFLFSPGHCAAHKGLCAVCRVVFWG